jgi:hypothetical protein
VFGRITGAAMRGILVALLVATPSLLLPGFATDSTEIVALLAILAGSLTFVEYNTHFPSFVEFRDAPPLNRMRFVALFLMVFILTALCKHLYEPSTLTALFTGLGTKIGELTDFPYSPVRLIILMLPNDISSTTVDVVRMAAGVSYLIALTTVVLFLLTVRILGWPTGNGAFNVWVNLPLFDPTTGGDVVLRLQRDGRTNVILGVLLPFIIPALVKLASDLIDPITMENPQTMIWTISAWAFLPASLMMRGIAMLRIADLIQEKRRRAYANAEALQTA